MRKIIVGALSLLTLVVQVRLVFGTLVILRGREQRYYYSPASRKLLCISEDDGGGLIWNGNLVWQQSSYAYSDRSGNTDFYELMNYKKDKSDCDMNSMCITSWSHGNWTLTNSIDTPTGPVFDRRWEVFREHNNFAGTNEYVPFDEFKRTGALTFSVRGSTDAHILLCESKDLYNDFCYWIIIGGWENTLSVIRKCAHGVPVPPENPTPGSECAEHKANYSSPILSPTQWKTFVLTWNETTKNITLYDTKKMLMTYVDNGNGPKRSILKYTPFWRSRMTILFRFHIYSFLRTNDYATALTSPRYYPYSTNVCFQILIGLCAECQMEIVLVDPKDESNKETLDTVRGSTVAAVHGLPMWQSVKIDTILSSEFATVLKVKFIPKLESPSDNPFWAVANFRSCPPTDAVRYGAMEAFQDYYTSYYWPEVTCQKLSYNEQAVVNSTASASLNITFDDLYCPEGNVGPYCSINCLHHLETGVDCKGTVICLETGCTCPPGFIGDDCRSVCQASRYGHDCKETCGFCIDALCNFKTGICPSGCNDSTIYHIPPFCKTGIEALPPPEIDFLNETTVRAIVPARDEYKELPSEYLFLIKRQGESDSKNVESFKIIFKNTSELTGNVDDLLPGTVYSISCILYVGDSQIPVRGEWRNFTTRCTPNIKFNVEVGETNLRLYKSQETNAMYPCPLEWYDVKFENVSGKSRSAEETSTGNLTHLPFEFSNLLPGMNYKITVGKGSAPIFSGVFQTLEGVKNLRRVQSFSTEVTLQWDPPRETRNIVYYEVTLELDKYLGCEKLNRDSPKNVKTVDTMSTGYTFSDVHPYAHYMAKVAVWTHRRGVEKSLKFTTEAAEIPTSMPSNLNYKGNKLYWEDPEDCTTISGPIPVARIMIDGVSDSVKDFHDVKNTKNQYLNLPDKLHGAETYRARVFFVREYKGEHNELRCAEKYFTTPPRAPPGVTNLDIFEADLKAATVSLRWQEPQPPTNGIIESYVVEACFSACQIVRKIPSTEHCEAWKDYICVTVQKPRYRSGTIRIYATNVNVSIPGERVPITVQDYKLATRPPQNLTIDSIGDGILNVLWYHPWKTAGRVEKFNVIVEMLSSKLRQIIPKSQQGMIYDHIVSRYQPRYDMQLNLLSSTTYRISVLAVTNSNVLGTKSVQEVETPLAVAFENDLSSEVSNVDSTIILRIPTVLNDTKDSLMTVVVKGPRDCQHYSKLTEELNKIAGVKDNEDAWRAATFPTYEYAGKRFTVGDNKLYNGSMNCPLKPEESYVIVVIVQAEQGSMDGHIVRLSTSIRIGEVPRRHHEAWFIPIIILVVVVVAAYLVYRRRRKGTLKKIILQEEMALAYNADNVETKSILSSTKQTLSASTPSDKESLSRMSTPEVQPLAIDMNQKEEKTSLVKVKDFEDYVREAILSGLLDKQYDTFPRGQTRPWDYGKLPQNKAKNRYGNLIAYDETRVILKKLPDDPYSDYINANYITGYKKEKCYIATQGPKTNTVVDFWRMIWQEEVLIICMLANVIESGKTKCEQYWPDIGKKKKYGEVIVLNAKHNVFADYTFRTLHVSCGDEKRKIEHLHYTAWPDHGVPLYTHSVVTYLKKLLATPPGNGPVVIHCSAGVGRTGTIILCDICLRRAAAEGVVDVFAETESIRNQRANMVDNKQQYLLAHLALVECLLSLPTALPCNETLPQRIKELKTQLVIQQHRLQNTAWQDEALRPQTSQTSLSERNVAKNRFPELLSGKVSRVYLKRYPPTDEDSDYISAVYVDGVRQQNQYLATQLPLPSTLSDFWRMVAEFKVELIVMLQPPDPEDTTCCPIAPKNGEFKPTPYINVITKETKDLECYATQKLVLIDNSEKPTREQQVTILCCTQWNPGRNQDPPSVMTLVTLWQAAERISRGEGPTVILCHDGVTGCGLYLALSFLLERMAVERECDVCLAIRAVRRSRPDFVRSVEHMEYLYDAAVTYLEYFETYANFT